MMRPVFRLSAGLAIVVTAAAPAIADDARIATHPYSADEIVKLEGKMNVQATISFADGERIENVAVGDPDSWQIVPNKRADLLFVKPLLAAARTNMTVVTDRRTYFFDLVASAAAKPIYALRFTYPPSLAGAPGQPSTSPAPPPQTMPTLAQNADLAEIEAARREVLANPGAAIAPPAPVAMPTISVPVPPVWRRSGSDKLMPAMLRDDGASTFMQWGPGVPIPSLFTVDPGGREAPLAYAVQGDGIVVNGVPQKIVLRAARARAVLERVPAPLTGQSAMADPAGRSLPVSK